ncbi:BRCA2 repeat family protein [Histomonas meleagridis]|uniref:BRCA2 repeat family protein n=1 Tax=Histomonas meleagridis TaxID=135588 RepID=UPI00355A9588|nr:BRCA2 repeat family protein [Histomonas meleagridis]KAH0799649.1 BRCA2 repeat family protein [Histomonas meleagridis]
MQRKRSLQIEDRSKRNSGDLQNKKKLEININDQKDKENSLEIKNDTSGGFSLASGKPVNVSKESLKRAQKFLQIEDNSNKNTGENIGFSLATGKPVEVSKESLRRAQNLLQIDGNSNMNTEESVGFSLASGKPVNVSKESLQRAQNLLQIESNPNMNTEKIVGFSLASGRPVNVSKESLQRAQNLLQIDGNSNVNTEENVGFSFANGKPVNVSRESLQRAQNLLQIECNPNINTEENVGFLFANGKPVNVLNESLQRAQSLLQIDGNSNVNTEENVGFSFASGKPVNVSKESLQRAQNLLQIDANFNTENTEENIGFSFANGKPVNVSRESLQRAQNLLQIEDKPNMNTEESVGFSFASGKPVNVSKESLQRAQNLLQIDSNYSNNDESVGFSFANGRPMPKLSEESLRRAQNLLQVDSSNSDESVGFSFANGKSMPKVSDSAMNRARSLFENDISRSPIRPHIDSAPLSPPMSPKHSLKKLSPSSVALSHATGIPLSLKSPTQEQTIIRNKLLSSPPPKRNAFKPPKQIVSPNNNNNGQPQVKVLPKPQKSNLTKPFFDISKLNDIQRMTLSEFSIFHGRPNHDEEISFLPSDAESYRFPNGNGYADAYVSLIEKGFDPLLLKPKWVQNHYKWIVWKLKNLDISYPQITIPLLTFDNVVKELEYRAQLEILEAKRSCVRLLYERDASPNVYMILMVSNILNDGNLELTDGWYSIPTIIDILLLDLVKENKITIGMKLRICNAQFDGEEATGPLDEDRSTKLILRINSVRHARWDSQLGFQRYALFPVNINSLYANGGLLPFIEVVVQKKYPYFYRESFKDENVPSIIRTQAQQLEYMQKMEQNFSEELLKLRQEWLKELKEEGTDVQNSNKFLQQYLDSNDQGLFLSSINSLEKKQELISLIEKHQFQEEEFLRSKSEEFITENTNEFSTFFTLSITDLCPGIHKDAEITFWRLPLELYDEIKEGNAYRIFQVETSENRNDLLISKNQTKIIKIESQPQYLTMIYRPRKLLEKFSDSYIYYNEMKLPTGTEFDFIGFVLYLYDDGKLGSEYVSIVSNITPVYTNDAIGHFTRLLS